MLPNPHSPSELDKLTVAQLKALCKDAKITGYSKLSKAALTEKLRCKLFANSKSMEGTGTGTVPGIEQNAITSGGTDGYDGVLHKSLPQVTQVSSQVLLHPVPEVIQSSSSDAYSLGTQAPNPPSACREATETVNNTTPGGLKAITMTEPSGVSLDRPLASLSTVPSTQTGTKNTKRKSMSTVEDNRSYSHTERGQRIPEIKKRRVQEGNGTSLLAEIAATDNALSGTSTETPHSATTKQPKYSRQPLTGSQKSQGLSNILTPSKQPAPVQASSPKDRATSSRTLVLARISISSINRTTEINAARHTAPSRRFRKLIPQVQQQAFTTAAKTEKRCEVTSLLCLVLRHLDFAYTNPVPPERISLPISLADRKRVGTWAIILSGLSDGERRVCARVSRLIRYAVYLSAMVILDWHFLGRRYAQLKQKFPATMSNYWPYLCQRRCEVMERKSAFQSSFLARIFGAWVPISQRMWCSPDHPKQTAIALRFALTRAWFSISVGSRLHKTGTHIIVTDAQEVVKDEIWSVSIEIPSSITTESSSRKQTFYVLEQTCEVIGRAQVSSPASTFTLKPSSWKDTSASQKLQSPVSSTAPLMFLRVDWSDYIETRLLSAGFHTTTPPSLLRHLRWPNVEDYFNGISRLWLKRIEGEGVLGEYKRIVAERYVMACVVGKSVGGEWMSATHMAQDFAGTAAVTSSAASKRDKPKVNLFLPQHHFVESVHFMTSTKKPLHNALAVVQTPNREYYILRDNGMEVGCEEDGVWDVWRDIIRCDERGVTQTPTKSTLRGSSK